MFLGPLVLRYIDVDTYYPLWPPVAVVGDKTAHFDPSDFAARTDDTVFRTVFSLLVTKCAAPELFQPDTVFRVYSGPPLATLCLGGAVRKTVNGRVSFRQLQPFCFDVVGKATDQGGFSGQLELLCAL